MAKPSDTYQKLFADFSRIETEMRDSPEDGQQASLRTAARAIVRFEHEHQLPKLKQLVADHGAAVAAIEAAKQKLTRLERSIANQRLYITARFPTADTTTDAIDLLAWELSAKLGGAAIERLVARAAEIEQELKLFVRDRKNISDCLAVEQEHGWSRTMKESFLYLFREFEQPQQTAQEAA
ncbi:MAG: hypothetical protein QOH39_3033 [Verrucomicrobiota bacterium]|jgi:hypothetical protein